MGLAVTHAHAVNPSRQRHWSVLYSVQRNVDFKAACRAALVLNAGLLSYPPFKLKMRCHHDVRSHM